jgi:hypothetical protein
MLTLRKINCMIFMILNLLARSNGNISLNHCVLIVFLRDKVSVTLVFFFDIDIFVNCNWVDTRWQYTFTHKQYIEHHN